MAYFTLSLPLNETSLWMLCISLQMYQLYHLPVNCLQNENIPHRTLGILWSKGGTCR